MAAFRQIEQSESAAVIVRRYLTRSIYAYTALVLVSFVALFILLDVLHELTDLGKGVYKWEMEKVGTAQVNIQTVYASKYVSEIGRAHV